MAYQAIYVHIPFCLSSCNYCDFVSHVHGDYLDIAANYSQYLVRELELHHKEAGSIETIYLGGGTPTILEIAALGEIMAGIQRKYRVRENAEITIETNPALGNLAYFQDLRALGFNRLSIGSQSFIDRELALMGRRHQSHDIRQTVEIARQAGFNNVGLDLIYGLPNQTVENWQYNLQEAVRLAPEHISLYSLQLDNNSKWGQMASQGLLQAANEDLSAEMLQAAIDILKDYGYQHYEIANFARKDHTDWSSKHNTCYWQRHDYLGVGLGASSALGNKRWQNIGSLGEYVAALDKHQLPPREAETLNKEQVLFEAIFLGLRMRRGLKISEINQQYNVDILKQYESVIHRLLASGLLVLETDRLTLSKQGMFLANQVFLEFLT